MDCVFRYVDDNKNKGTGSLPLNSGWGVVLQGLFPCDEAPKIAINSSPGKKSILKIRLLEPEIYPIKVQRLLTFELNFKMCRLS